MAEFVEDLEDVFLIEEEKDKTAQTVKDLNDERCKTKRLNDQISNLNAQILALNEKIKTNEDEISKAHSGSDLDKQNYLRKLISEKNQLETDLSDIQTKLNQQNIDMDILATKKKDLDRQIVQLTNDNNNMKSDKFTEIQAQKKEIDDLKRKIQEVEKRADTTEKKQDATTINKTTRRFIGGCFEWDWFIGRNV